MRTSPHEHIRVDDDGAHTESRITLRSLAIVVSLPFLFACGDTLGGGGPNCEDSGGIAFCADRVDDDCDGVDEDCPSTQPADAPPSFSCGASETPPSSILAFTALPENAQVAGGCVFVYQGDSGAFYAAVRVTDGSDPRGPDGVAVGLCDYDTSARRHLFFTTSPVSDCEEVAYVYPDEIENQILSTSCRRMVRNLSSNDPGFDPDIQFLPGPLSAQEERLARFDTAEVACLRINNGTGAPYRADELFVTQAQASFSTNAGFVAQ